MKLFLLTCFCLIRISFQNATISYDCLSMNSEHCSLTNINFNKTEETLIFNSNIREEVFRVTVSKSSISVLTSDFCKSFRNTEIFKLQSIALEKINENALESCEKLSNFDAMKNYLRYLDEKTFKSNKNLEYLFLSTNKLRCLPVKIFHGLKNLKELYLSYNNLRFLHPETFSGLTDLRLLSLQSNELLEFDASEVVRHLSKLNTIHLKYNEIKCSEFQEILKVLREKNLTFDRTLTQNDCEPDEEYELRNSCMMKFEKNEKSKSRKLTKNSVLIAIFYVKILILQKN
ncbi:leucine-rich repeat-containing protein 70-like [Culicoides brevitarsis]|uniref:leucine-rich repeat-containing protein 70-like n=1 Tax=Culicoides brevitarsis TaxID=469753 RepID=UPI00307C2BEE